MVSGTTESLNCAGNGGTCDHSWLTMLLGNAPQFENSQSRVGIWVRIQNQFHFTIPFTSYMLHHSFFLFFFISLSHTKTNTVVPTCFLADAALCLFNWFKSLQIPFIQWEGDWMRGERPNMLQRKGRDAETDQISLLIGFQPLFICLLSVNLVCLSPKYSPQTAGFHPFLPLSLLF